MQQRIVLSRYISDGRELLPILFYTNAELCESHDWKYHDGVPVVRGPSRHRSHGPATNRIASVRSNPTLTRTLGFLATGTLDWLPNQSLFD